MRAPHCHLQWDEASGRVRSVALAYRRLQPAAAGEAVEFATLLRELWRDLAESLLPGANASVEIDRVVNADPVLLGADEAVSLALIVNELTTNALKHGRHADGTGLQIRLGRSNEGCRLAVRNAGILPAGFDPTACSGFGMRMVTLLSQQLGGRVEAACLGGETVITVTFRPRLAQSAILAVVAASVQDAVVD